MQTIKVKALANTENWHPKALWYSILGTKGKNDRQCICAGPLALRKGWQELQDLDVDLGPWTKVRQTFSLWANRRPTRTRAPRQKVAEGRVIRVAPTFILEPTYSIFLHGLNPKEKRAIQAVKDARFDACWIKRCLVSRT